MSVFLLVDTFYYKLVSCLLHDNFLLRVRYYNLYISGARFCFPFNIIGFNFCMQYIYFVSVEMFYIYS